MRPPEDPNLARSPRREQSPIELFVDELAEELALSDSASDRRTGRLLRRLVDWTTSEGMPLDREVIFDPDNVERFTEMGLTNDRSAATYRSVLREVGPRLASAAALGHPARRIQRRNVAPPYTPREIELLKAAGTDQPTEGKVRAARALLALGLGAGLDGRWSTKVKALDVSVRAGIVSVDVRAPNPRHVVVLAAYEDEVLDLAIEAGDQFLVGGYSTSKNRSGQLAAGLHIRAGSPRLSPARLRSTWLLWHLEAGTRLPELCQAAGLVGLSIFSDLLDYLQALDPPEAAAMLRGGDMT